MDVKVVQVIGGLLQVMVKLVELIFLLTISFTYVTGVQINDNAWHFISVTRDESTGLIEFFVDGELVNSEIGATGLVSNSNNMQFGLQQIYNPAFYQGELENLQIFNRILSEDEIQSYLNAPTGEELV